MARFGDDDLPVFFADMGVPVSYNGTTGRGIFGQNQEANADLLDTRVERYTTTLLIEAGTLGTIEEDATIVVDGVSFKVRDVETVRDGALERVILAPLT